MTALICALNTKYIHSSLAPWYLKASIAERYPSVKCDILEFTINESQDKLFEQITKREFDIIGFSTYIWNIEIVLSLCEKIKKSKNVKIFLGGPEVSYNSSELLEKYPFIDYIVAGEGEKPVAELCSGEVALDEILGLCYRKDGKIITKEPFTSSDDPPYPYSDEYFECLKGRISYLETSRGCPYRCAFCLSGRCGGVRFFDLERSKKSILALSQGGSKTIKFVDRTFNADKKRARELFSFIIDNCGEKIPSDVCFHFEIEGDILDDETIELLSKAKSGLFQMEIGLQSFNPQTLTAINRKANTDRLCENIKKLILLGNIHIHIDLIAGLPYEDIKSIAESFNKALSLRPHMLQLGFLKLLHGAKLRENPELLPCEYRKDAPYEVTETKWLSREELTLLHTIEDFFDKFYNSGRFPRLEKYIFETVKNPFEFYTGLALFVKETQESHSLDALSLCIYNYLAKIDDLDIDIVRDLMAMDRLATNREGALPEFLKIHSPKLKEYLNMLEGDPKTKSKKGIKRAITLLKTENAIVYVDYDTKNPVTKEYELIKYII